MGGPDDTALQEALDAFKSSRRIPGIAAALATPEGPAWLGASGFADIESETLAETDTIFRVGSITKTLTAAAVMQLRDEGRLVLDDPLPDHLPELREMVNPWGRIDEITIRRVLTHESGLPVESPAFDWATGQFPQPEGVLASLAGVELPVPPDAQVKYSNLGYQLLGELVARTSGATYRQRLNDAIFEPLGMSSSSFAPDAPQKDRMAKGHWPAAFTDRPETAPERPKETDADGGLCSTVEDLAKWIALQFRAEPTRAATGGVLSPRTIAEMHRPRHMMDAGWTRAMALGWRVFWREEGVLIGHSGSTFGFASQALFSPRHKVGVVVLANGEEKVMALAERMINIATDPSTAERTPLSTPVTTVGARATAPPPKIPTEFQEFLGLYAWEDHTILVRLEWREGRLTLVWLDEESHVAQQHLESTDDTDIFIVHGGRESGETLTFRRNASGAISGFTSGGWPQVKLMSVLEDADT